MGVEMGMRGGGMKEIRMNGEANMHKDIPEVD